MRMLNGCQRHIILESYIDRRFTGVHQIGDSFGGDAGATDSWSAKGSVLVHNNVSLATERPKRSASRVD